VTARYVIRRVGKSYRLEDKLVKRFVSWHETFAAAIKAREEIRVNLRAKHERRARTAKVS
jgi:hypothetical protein